MFAGQFCFPKGIKLFERDQNPTYFNFVLTNEEGKRTFISSLIFTEKLDKNPFGDVRSPLHFLSALSSERRNESGQFLRPEGLLFDGRVPFLRENDDDPSGDLPDAWTSLWKPSGKDHLEFNQQRPLSLARWLQSPFRNQLEAHQVLPASFLPENSGNQSPFSSFRYSEEQTQSFECLLSFLDPLKVLKVVEYILLEKKILLITENSAVLAMVIDALLSLVFPFKWNQRLIPVLPDSLKHYAESPLPFIIGIVKDSQFDEARLHLSSDVIRVYLDSNDIFALDTEPFGIPHQILKGTIQRLEPFAQYHKALSALPFKKMFGLALDSRKSTALTQ